MSYFLLLLMAGSVSALPNYSGQKMTVLTADNNVGLGIHNRANAFNALTGAQVEVVRVPRDRLVEEEALELSTGTVLYDAYVSTGSDMIAYQVQNLLPLNDFIDKDEEIRWSDIGSWFRTLGVYNNEILSLPLDGDFHLMYYRQDVLAKAGLAPPKTLEEMLSVAKAINGTDMDGDGHGDVGFCFGLGAPSQGFMIASLLVSLIQSKGTSQGYLFDPNTMEALQDNPAMADGLRMIAEMITLGSNKNFLQTLGWDVRGLFTSGKCGMTVDWGDIAGLSIGSYVNGLTGMSRLPGSRKVWDREQKAYRACDTVLCPFGGDEGINSAIYAFGGWSYQINRKIKEERHQFVYDFGSYMCSPKISAEDAVDGTTGLEPYRYSHMLAGLWVAAGMAPASADNYVHALADSLDSKNIDVARAVGYSVIRDNFHHAVLAVTEGTSPAEAATQLSAANNLVVQQNGGAEVLLPAYRKALGLTTSSLIISSSSDMPTWMIPTFSALGGVAVLVMIGLVYRFQMVSKQADKIYSDQAIAEQIAESVQEMRLEELDYLHDLTNPNKMQRIFINITETLKEYRSYIPKSVLNTLDQNHQMKGKEDCVMIALVNPPASGRVAIVFTDIQSSTMTWEGAPFEMKTALELHNDVIRKAAGEYDGYEVKTIGDAFMLAFADLDNAAKFCLAVQVDLTEVDWPEGLLDLPQCAKVPHAFSGLRLRMGLHYGEVEKQDNAMTGRADYFGTVVNIAARLEAAGRGGGITVEKAVLDKLQPASLNASVLELGEVELKGIKNRQTLSLLIPQALRERKMCLQKILSGYKENHSDNASSRSSASAASSLRNTAAKPRLALRTALEVVNATTVHMRLSFSQTLKKKSTSESLYIVNDIVAPIILACEQTSGVIAALSTTGIDLTWLGLRNASHVQNAIKFIGMLHKPLFISTSHIGACSGSVLAGNVGTSQKFNMQIGECASIAERLSKTAKEFRVFAVISAEPNTPCACSDPGMLHKVRPLVRVDTDDDSVIAYQLKGESLLESWFDEDEEEWSWSPAYTEMFMLKDVAAIRQNAEMSPVMQQVVERLDTPIVPIKESIAE